MIGNTKKGRICMGFGVSLIAILLVITFIGEKVNATTIESNYPMEEKVGQRYQMNPFMVIKMVFFLEKEQEINIIPHGILNQVHPKKDYYSRVELNIQWGIIFI